MSVFIDVRIARRAPDRFGRIVAGAITAWIVGQAVINMGAVTGLLPITGVPLPLISYSGSFVLMIMFGLGLVNSVWIHRKIPE